MLSKLVGSSKNKQPTIKYSKRNFSSLAEAPSSTRTSTLSNGVRIVSMEFARPTAAVGVVVNAGTRHEDSHSLGSTAFLKHLGFQNSKSKTAVRLVREFELMGATYTVAASREQLSYMAQCRFENVKDVVPLLAEATEPQFASYQIADAIHPVEEESVAEKADPRNYVLDALHGQAFRHTGLGNSLYVTPDVAHHATVDSVKKFHDKLFVPQNLSIVGVGGVKHDQLVELAQKLFPASKASQSSSIPSQYRGGELIQPVAIDNTYFGIGYQGIAASHALAPASYILRFILGEASRAGCEPVGNGVSGLLARNVFSDHAALQHLEASTFSYSDSGLVTVYGVAEAAKDYKYVSHLGNMLAAVPSALNQQLLQRGKALAKGHLAFQLTASLPSLAEYLASQAVANPTASNFAPSHLSSAIDSVSLEQLQQAAKQIFSSKPTVVAVGAVNGFPSL